jgi:hypothetical protein
VLVVLDLVLYLGVASIGGAVFLSGWRFLSLAGKPYADTLSRATEDPASLLEVLGGELVDRMRLLLSRSSDPDVERWRRVTLVITVALLMALVGFFVYRLRP